MLSRFPAKFSVFVISRVRSLDHRSRPENQVGLDVTPGRGRRCFLRVAALWTGTRPFFGAGDTVYYANATEKSALSTLTDRAVPEQRASVGPRMFPIADAKMIRRRGIPPPGIFEGA
jgi:hypothetical protein